jgi:hypothetical protein
MIVLSVEGQRHMDRDLWSTHKILGVFETEEQAMNSPLLEGLDDEDVCLVTDLTAGTVKRVNVG